MRHGLIREFAKENFGPSYYVVPHGQQRTFQPLALIVNEGRSFRGASRRVVMETLDKYLTNDVKLQSAVIKLMEQNLVLGQEHRMDGAASASSSLEVGMDVTETIGVTTKKDVNYGQLQLGLVQEEFYREMTLREILSKAKLDESKMRPYEKKKLYLITNVVYSTKLEITGDREKTEEVDARVSFPRYEWLSNLKASVSVFLKTTPPPPLGRQERSPLLFAYAKIKYNPESQLFELKQLVGASFRTKGMGAHKDVVPDSTVDGEKYFLSKEFSVYDDLRRFSQKHTEAKLQAISEILQKSENFTKSKITIAKFLNLVSMAVSKDGKNLAVEVPISKQEKIILQYIGIELEVHNDATLLRVPCVNKSKVQEFIEIFRIFSDMEENEWFEIRDFIDKTKHGNSTEDILANTI